MARPDSTWERYVAIGDSSTEGLEDPDGRGGYRGWANRLAEQVAASQGSLLYANLAVRGRHTRQVRDEQLEPALEMKPDLVTLFVGSNDAVSRRFDPAGVGADVEFMQGRLIEAGATVIGFTLPDLTGVMPLGQMAATRVAQLNDVLRQVSAATGALLVDFAAYPMASDRRIWSEDGFHANPLGHERIAAALAHALGVPESNDSWALALPAQPPPSRPAALARDLDWWARYFVPWLWRHALGRSSGDGRKAKRPRLEAVELAD